MNIDNEIGLYLLTPVFGIFIGSIVNAVSNHFLNTGILPYGSPIFSGHLRALAPITLIKALNFIFSSGPKPDETRPRERYELFTELLCGLGVPALYLKFGFTPGFFVLTLFSMALLAIFRIDLEKMIIPDAISLNGIWLGFLLSSFDLIPFVDWKFSVYGILVGAAILYVPAYLYRLIKGSDGLGGGDIKLMAMVGAFTGVQGVIFTLFVASLSGCLAGLIGFLYKRISSNSLIPFGPFISSSAILYIFLGRTIICDFFGLPDYF